MLPSRGKISLGLAVGCGSAALARASCHANHRPHLQNKRHAPGTLQLLVAMGNTKRRASGRVESHKNKDRSP